MHETISNKPFSPKAVAKLQAVATSLGLDLVIDQAGAAKCFIAPDEFDEPKDDYPPLLEGDTPSFDTIDDLNEWIMSQF